MLTLQGLGDQYTDYGCAEGDDACLQAAQAQIQTMIQATPYSPPPPNFNYSGWACTSCDQLPASTQQAQCKSTCEDPAAMAALQSQLTAQSTSGLPSGTQPSATPNLPGAPTPGSLPQAINWWVIGGGVIVGLAIALGLWNLSHRSA